MKAQPLTPEDPESSPSAINKRLAIRAHTLQHELQTLQHENKMLQEDHKRLIMDLYSIAEALGGKEEGFGVSLRSGSENALTGSGIAPSTILERIKEIKDASDFFNPR